MRNKCKFFRKKDEANSPGRGTICNTWEEVWEFMTFGKNGSM